MGLRVDTRAGGGSRAEHGGARGEGGEARREKNRKKKELAAKKKKQAAARKKKRLAALKLAKLIKNRLDKARKGETVEIKFDKFNELEAAQLVVFSAFMKEYQILSALHPASKIRIIFSHGITVLNAKDTIQRLGTLEITKAEQAEFRDVMSGLPYKAQEQLLKDSLFNYHVAQSDESKAFWAIVIKSASGIDLQDILNNAQS